MNALAAQMHLGRTHFSNFDGLPVPTEYSTYSTPGDLLLIGRAAMTYPVFRAVVSQRRYHLAAGPGHHAYIWHNTNLLLGAYPGIIGIKTGSTQGAGYSLLFEAQRGPAVLIGVVLDSSPTQPRRQLQRRRAPAHLGLPVSQDAPAEKVTPDEFFRTDIRVGKVISAEKFPAARKPAVQAMHRFRPAGGEALQRPDHRALHAGAARRAPRHRGGQLPAPADRHLHVRGPRPGGAGRGREVILLAPDAEVAPGTRVF